MQLYLLLALCGVAMAKETFIVGGKNVTEPGKWPWMGQVQMYRVQRCGISLIGTRWGLTSAHCTYGLPPFYNYFIFGSNDASEKPVSVKANRIIEHESYPGTHTAYDIALVEFEAEIKGNNIGIIPLAPKGANYTGNKDCWITGWGNAGKNGPRHNHLQEATASVITNEVCKMDFPRGDVYDGNVCIGKTSAPCEYDTGSPLVCKVDGRYELVGVASYGSFYCGTRYSPYTRVSYFRDWIKTNSGI